MKRELFPFLMLVFALLCSATSRAHTGLVQSSPADGAMKQVSPPAIELVFGADVRLVDLRLADDTGLSVKLARSRDLTPATRFRMSVPELAAGNYRVDWIAMGADSHKMTGHFVFSIEASTGQ